MYAIHATYHYYAGTLNRRRDGLLSSPCGPLLFLDVAAAEQHIADLQPAAGQPPMLDDGQYQLPDYEIVPQP